VWAVRLDSAFCQRKLRRVFGALVYNPSTVFTFAAIQNKRDTKLELVLSWAVARKARLDGLIIDSRFEQYQELLFAFITTGGSAIRWVQIECCQLAGAIFSQQALLKIAKWCPEIRQLTVRITHAADEGLLWDTPLIALTKSCRKVIDLTLIYARFSEEGLANALQYCCCLEHISISTEEHVIPVDIALPTLKSIIFGSCISDVVLSAIGQRCTKLEKLVMFKMFGFDEQTTDAAVCTLLQGCPLLRETDVEHAEGISTELRVALARRRNLTTLCTGEWLGMDNELAQGVLKGSPSLTKLIFTCEYSEWLTDATLAVCAQYCPLITRVTMTGCPLVTNDGVRLLVSSLGSTLRSLNVQDCPLLSDDVLLAVAEHCPLLQDILCDVNGSDAAVVKLAEGCPHLRFLYLPETVGVSDATVEKLAESCTKLGILYLYKAQVGYAGLTALATHCANLVALYLRGCRNVTIQDVHNIVTSCPHLMELGLPVHLRGQQLPQLGGRRSKLEVMYI
jgi:hypothetical protein